MVERLWGCSTAGATTLVYTGQGGATRRRPVPGVPPREYEAKAPAAGVAGCCAPTARLGNSFGSKAEPHYLGSGHPQTPQGYSPGGRITLGTELGNGTRTRVRTRARVRPGLLSWVAVARLDP